MRCVKSSIPQASSTALIDNVMETFSLFQDSHPNNYNHQKIVQERCLKSSLKLDNIDLHPLPTNFGSVEYKLASVVHHKGHTGDLNKGHYYTDCFGVTEVVRYNDSVVTPIEYNLATSYDAQKSAYIIILQRHQ